MNFKHLCISFYILVETNLASGKNKRNEAWIAKTNKENDANERLRAGAKVQVNSVQARNIAEGIFYSQYSDGMSNLDVYLVETDRSDVTFGTLSKKSSTTEVTSWGTGNVLEDIKFWDNLDPPSESIKICTVGSGYDITHTDLPKAPDVSGSNSSRADEAWSAAIGNNNKGVSYMV